MKNIIELTNVGYKYGLEPILTEVNLTVKDGDYVGIIGPNGGGKTTLLKLMLGLLTPATGEVRLFGKSLAGFKDWSKIGYVPQKVMDFEAHLPITVEEVVRFGRVKKRGFGRWLSSADTAAALAALETVGMQDFAKRQITELSGGQQQRVFIAKALACEPKALLLDEPTVGIDARSQHEFYRLLDRLNREGITMVMVSHDVDVVVKEVNHLVWVNEKVAYDGVPQNFDPSDYLKALYGKDRQFIRHVH